MRLSLLDQHSHLLEKDGHKILSVSRSTSGDVLWDPTSGQIEAEKARGIDAVIHLAGENIASIRLTDKQKRRILDSRVEGTKTINKIYSESLKTPSLRFLSGSAIGIYGNRGDEELDEDSSRGSGFYLTS